MNQLSQELWIVIFWSILAIETPLGLFEVATFFLALRCSGEYYAIGRVWRQALLIGISQTIAGSVLKYYGVSPPHSSLSLTGRKGKERGRVAMVLGWHSELAGVQFHCITLERGRELYLSVFNSQTEHYILCQIPRKKSIYSLKACDPAILEQLRSKNIPIRTETQIWGESREVRGQW